MFHGSRSTTRQFSSNNHVRVHLYKIFFYQSFKTISWCKKKKKMIKNVCNDTKGRESLFLLLLFFSPINIHATDEKGKKILIGGSGAKRDIKGVKRA